MLRNSKKFLLIHFNARSVNCAAFFVPENKVTGLVCLDMLAFCFRQLNETHNPDVMFQQDGGPPRVHNAVRTL
jgi:hypothetical protein